MAKQKGASNFGWIREYISINGSKRYYASYIGADGTRYKADHPFLSFTQARYFLDNIKQDIVMNRWQKPKTKKEQEQNNILFNDYALKHLKEREIADTTRKKYIEQFNNYIRDYFGNKVLKEITSTDVKDWFYTIDKTKERLTTSVLMLVKLIFNQAIKDEIISKNPAQHIQAKKTSKIPLQSDIQGALLEKDEINTLINNTPGKYRLLIVLGAYLGLRIGEALALQVKDVDIKGLFVLVKKSVYHTGGIAYIKDTKNHKERFVPIPPQAKDYFIYHLKYQAEKRANAFLFARKKDNMPIYAGLFRDNYFSKIRLSIARPSFRFHDLRHTCLTYYARKGATVRDLMEIAGHSKPDIVMIYQETTKKRLSELAKKLKY